MTSFLYPFLALFIFIYFVSRFTIDRTTSNLRRFNETLLSFLIFLRVISIYKVPYLPIAPDNFFYGFVLIILIVSNKIYSNRFNKRVNIILVTYIIYQILKIIITNITGGAVLGSQYWILRDYLLLVSFILVINEYNYEKYLKLYTIVLFISMFFGLLIHFVGEPFASLRLQIINNPTMFYYGKGQRLVGLNYSIFSFAYPITILPILLLTFYKITLKRYWIIMLILSFIGIVLNGERISMILAGSVILFMINKWFNVGNKILIYILLLVFFTLFQSNLVKDRSIEIEGGSLTRIYKTSYDDLRTRILKQYAGFITALKHPITGGTLKEFKKETYSLLGYAGNYPHNAFVNIGLYAGYSGWFLFIIFFSNILKLLRRFKYYSERFSNNTYIYQCIIMSFWSLIGVSLFHNDGIFEGETTSLIILGFILGSSNLDLSKFTFIRGTKVKN